MARRFQVAARDTFQTVYGFVVSYDEYGVVLCVVTKLADGSRRQRTTEAGDATPKEPA